MSEALRQVVLRLHVFQLLSTEQLGRVFHVAPFTVRRWIQGARATVLENVRAMLTQIDSALAHLSTALTSQSTT